MRKKKERNEKRGDCHRIFGANLFISQAILLGKSDVDLIAVKILPSGACAVFQEGENPEEMDGEKADTRNWSLRVRK